MANLAFLRGTSTQVTSAPVVDGQLLVATDVGQLFVDAGASRVQINDVIKVTTLPEATAANVNKLYYATQTNILAVSNGTAWTQINAQQVIAEGSTNGTISVAGVDIPVHGLGSAAFTESNAYDAAGSAAAVLGDAEDTSADNTVYGAKAAATEAKSAAAAAQSAADAKLATVTAGDASVTIGGTATAPAVAVAISEDEGNALSLEDDGLKVTIGAAPEYSIVKDASAAAGFFATYHLTKAGANVGEAINIPKDYLVKSAEVATVETADDPYVGAVVGDKYIDFTVNTVGGDGNESHMYIAVKDLMTPISAGNGINVSASNQISAKVVTGNGLSVSEAGIAMAAATTAAAGAMSAADKTKLDGIAAGAEVNYVKSVSAPFSVSGAGALSASEATTSTAGLLSAADKAHLDSLVAGGEGYITSVTAPLAVDEGELSIGAASGSAAGTMSSADFTKLAGVAEGAEVNVIDAITFNGSAVDVSGKTAAITLAWTDLA